MKETEEYLKLKQASFVLEISPKELQNLVQFEVIKPRKRGRIYLFDGETLQLAASVVYLKNALDMSILRLKQAADALNSYFDREPNKKPVTIEFLLDMGLLSMPMKISIPYGKMVDRVEERISKAFLYKDLPRGRKRPNWKNEFFNTLKQAAAEMENVSDQDIRDTIAEYRAEKRDHAVKILVAAS